MNTVLIVLGAWLLAVAALLWFGSRLRKHRDRLRARYIHLNAELRIWKYGDEDIEEWERELTS